MHNNNNNNDNILRKHTKHAEGLEHHINSAPA